MGGQTKAPARWQAQPGQAGGVLLAYDTRPRNARALRLSPAQRQYLADLHAKHRGGDV
jgi:hypothetical protein